MSEVLQTDSHIFRGCILYETLRGNPIEETFQNMRKVMPNIDFSDFEFWYHRFLSGNYDLNHSEAEAPVFRFSDIPMNVVEKIVGNLGLVDKLSTRKVCPALRAAIDEQHSTFDEVSLKITEKFTEIHFEHQKLEFPTEKNGNCSLKSPQKTISLEDPLMALKEFSSVITHPKWKFKNLSVEFDVKDDSKPVLHLNFLLRVVHVEKLSITASSLLPVVTLLPHFKPSTLESLEFSNSEGLEYFHEESMEKITEMDQWKGLRQLKMASIPYKFPIEKLFHLQNFTVFNMDFRDEVFVKIRDILFKSPTFESCSLGYDLNPAQFFDLLGTIDRVMGAHTAYDPSNRRYQIDGSSDYFEISWDTHVDEWCFFEIRRKNIE